MNPIIISIEGNIGSGKSTLLRLLKERISKWTFLSEPIEDWLKIKDNQDTILNLFYQDKKRWSYTFQNMAFLTRTEQLEKNIEQNKIIVTERSIETDRNVFSKILYNSKFMNDIEYQVYLKLLEMYGKKNRFNGHIYLKTDVNISNSRILKRSRESESKIELDYLKKLETYHNEWLDNSNCVLILDGNKDFENNKEEFEIILKKIESFVLEIFLENVGFDQISTKVI
tara:strand:+ start:1559 stop:2239 length:681 start_codon:yes stop_codon:yes gene_type:complete